MKIGIIGERRNLISYSMLLGSLQCSGVKIVWFAEADLPQARRRSLQGGSFDYGRVVSLFKRINLLLKRPGTASSLDCKILCESRGIPYIMPAGNSLNCGMPEHMYDSPEADYALVAGCDQLLDKNGLRIALKKVLNYHYSPLPAYRGKNVLFWQWFNKEPFIGYSFHEVDLGIDTGEIIFQGRVEYDPSDSVHSVSARVISASASEICKVYECLRNDEKIVLFDNLASSFYPNSKYLKLFTVRPSRTVREMLDVFERAGYLKLKNGLEITRIVDFGNDDIREYRIDGNGITVPLADGYIKGTFSCGIPFRLCRLLIGDEKLLRNL